VVVVRLVEGPDDMDGRSAVLVDDGEDVVVRELDRPEPHRDPDQPGDVDQRRGWRHSGWAAPAGRSRLGAPAVSGGQFWRGGVSA
jgi:hypothetical protein